MKDLINGIDPGFEGFSSANRETLEFLTKALTAGSGVDAGSFTGGRALIPESMDNTLVSVLWTQDEAQLFKRLKKNPIKSPVHQWVQETGVGADDGAWVGEGGDSTEADPDLARKYGTAKYLQTLRKVTLQSTLTNSIEDAMTVQKNAGTLWLIRQIEKGLFYGNSSMIAEQPDGLVAQIPTSNVLDMRGANAASAMFENKFAEASRTIRDNYGKGELALCSTMVMEDVQKLLRDRLRVQPGENQGAAVFNKYPTPFGTPELEADIFIKEGGVPVASTLTSSRPGAPTSGGAVTYPSDGTASFAAADAGAYYYKIVAVNKYGDSVAYTTAALTVAAGQNITIPITEGSPAASAYKVYRSKKGAANADDCRYAFTVARTAATQNIVDRNWDLPGCSDMFLLTMNPVYDAIEWEQFLPMMKFDLYPTNAAVYPFLMMLFGFLALKKPTQHIRIKNISPYQLGWF